LSGPESITLPLTFRVARNPDPESRLPYLVWLPIDQGLALKVREPYPRFSRVFCAEADSWNDSAPLLDEATVVLCRRRGAAIDLVLDRPKFARSQFVFTNARGVRRSGGRRSQLSNRQIPVPEFRAGAYRWR
jgi:hypothetical protein